MEWHSILLFMHIVSFAAWFGTIFASLFLLKALEPKLTGPDEQQAAEFSSLLRIFLRLETKVADIGVIGVLISGILLATFHHGWTFWVFVKSALLVLQITLTLGYIVRAIQPLKYPCSAHDYARWYRLFGISLTMFALVLLCSFFLL
jgi:putative copper export protein